MVVPFLSVADTTRAPNAGGAGSVAAGSSRVVSLVIRGGT
jgi:hypothetical protein